MSFVHLQIQSSYSLLTSTVKIEELVKAAKMNGFTSLALTDRNVMYGSVYFYKECKKQGIKPIIGLIADVLDEGLTAHPLILLAQNKIGYENLMKISSALKTKSPQGLPQKWLRAYSAGLIAVSPGVEGEVETALQAEDFDKAEQAVLTYRNLFEENSFYLSLQRLHTDSEEILNERIRKLAAQLGVPLVATNPVYYLNKEDSLAQEVLLAVKNGDKLSDDNRTKLPSNEYYFKTAQEMTELFHDEPELLENTLKIASQCNIEIHFNRSLLPKYPVPSGRSAEEMLAEICRDGLRNRYPDANELYRRRLDYELSIIKKMNFSDYFLIVWDFMSFARKKRILTGPGRGSAAGSLVAYVLQITDVDPIEHSLLFERFLNPDRVTMPDIDIDFPDNRRDEVISYVAAKYGELHVAQIITFGTLAAKAAIRDTGRVFGLNPKEQEQLSKTIPSKPGTTLKDAYQESHALRTLIEKDPLNKSLFDIALKIEGLPRHTSTHAAGVIISDLALTDLIPIQQGHDGIYLTQFPMDLLEEIGLLKMDFLGLRNLTLIESILQSIERGKKDKVSIKNIPLNDELTFRLLSKGETTGVFQLESDGMRKVLIKLKPTCFEDIVAVNALYRPGPMDNIPIFIDRKHGQKPIDYPHEDLKPILENTYGVIVYQEQIMQIASKLAGFTLGEADLLRRAVSKKKKEVLDKERNHFVEGSIKQGYGKDTANDVYDLIVRFANYGFNRSHAVAYSLIAYQLAYLKAHYPAYFFAALLTSALGNEDKIGQYIKEAKQKNVPVLPPSINESTYEFQVGKAGIRFGLGAIKGIGSSVTKEILATKGKKEFADLFDFCLRVSGKIVNRKMLEAFVHSGAFDEFGKDRAVLLASLDVALEHAELVNPGDDQFDLFGNEFSLKPKYVKADPIGLEDKLSFEKSVLGLYLSDHPAAGARKLFDYFGADTIDQILLSKDKRVLVGVYLISLRTIRTKQGEAMAFLNLSDESGDMEAVVFPNVYKNRTSSLKASNLLMLEGTLEERNGKQQLIVQEVHTLEMLKAIKTEEGRTLYIKIEKAQHTKKVLMQVKKILQQHKGTTKVMLYYEREDRYISLSLLDWINPSTELMGKLESLAGNSNVIMKTE